MFDGITGVGTVQSFSFFEQTPSRNRTERQGRGDTVTLSEEGRRVLEEHKKQAASAGPADAVGEEKTLQNEFRDYLKNPTMMHAMYKMEKAVDDLGLDEVQSQEVLDVLKAKFRSGIPAKGEQTANTMASVKKDLKDLHVLSADQLHGLMEKLSNIVEEAQKEESRKDEERQGGVLQDKNF